MNDVASDQTPAADDNEAGLSADELNARRWNYRQMRRLGLSPLEARLLAEQGVSWHDVDHLVRDGCPVDIAARILV